MNPPLFSIAAVERDTGLSKDTLRVWERRYGFPTPARDAQGEREYSLAEVEKLRLMRRLMEAGHRPGRLVQLSTAELATLAEASPPPFSQRAAAPPSDVQDCMELVRLDDVAGLRRSLTQAMSRHGVARFVNDWIAPLNVAVGDAWLRGHIEVYQEHQYTEVVQVVLRQAIGTIPEAGQHSGPRVLLSTLPGEAHSLGLLMAEAMLALDGCHCVSLGVETPVWDTVLAARSHRSDIVALGFSGCLAPNQIVDGLSEMRQKLPPQTWLWAGGTAPVLTRRRLHGVQPITTLADVTGHVARWRQGQAPAPTSATGPNS
jgi:hypothetical protein